MKAVFSSNQCTSQLSLHLENREKSHCLLVKFKYSKSYYISRLVLKDVLFEDRYMNIFGFGCSI